MRTQTFISSMVGVAAAVAVAGSANAALVTGTFSGSTSTWTYYAKVSGIWVQLPNSPETRAFSGTFQFDTAGAYDYNTSSIYSNYNLSGTMTGGRKTAAGLTLESTVDRSGYLDSFKLYKIEQSGASDVKMSISANIPSDTYAAGDFVPTVPLNLTGLSGSYQDVYLPLNANNSSVGWIASGTITNLTLTVVPAPAAAALLGLAGLVAGRRRRN